MKKIIILLVVLSSVSCSSLYKAGIVGDDWCSRYCDDESLKKQAAEKYAERQKQTAEENKTPEQRFKEKVDNFIGKAPKDVVLEFGVHGNKDNRWINDTDLF